MELAPGTILINIAKDDYDLEVMASLGSTCAVRQIDKKRWSHIGVIAGLSLDPIELEDVTEPLVWYHTPSLLKHYKVKE